MRAHPPLNIQGIPAIRVKTGAFAILQAKTKISCNFAREVGANWQAGSFYVMKTNEVIDHLNQLHEYLPGDCRERIQDLLREHGMTQAQLAEKIGVSGGTLNRYISGKTDKIAAENIVKIARVFGASTDFLLCETNIPYRTNYDIETLGLTAKAAARLYTRKVDSAIVSQLLEHKEFAILVA